MNHIVLNIITSIDSKQAERLTQNPYLAAAVMSTHRWLAVTKQGDLVRRWHDGEVGVLSDYLLTGTVVGWDVLGFELVLLSINAKTQGYDWREFEVLDLAQLARMAQVSDQYPNGIHYHLDEVATFNLGYSVNSRTVDTEVFFAEPNMVFKKCFEQVQLEERLFQIAACGGLRFPTMKNRNILIAEWTLTLPTEA
jgi:hypothetical protein